ncbi:MAG TPA: hypothetical protein VNW46_05335 [Gemmatimonadaceae bacterium]|jgi:hypothetical protein|nr:hypothetical protein [Gemmatimonadaceae bacterium]
MRSIGVLCVLACATAAPVAAQTEDMPHMRMTTRTPPAPGDSARATAVAAAARASLAQYADYHQALADGFHIFAPNVRQRVYHFTSSRRALEARFHFDPAKPTSLLYERTGDSTYRLVGAMYTAPQGSSLADLNARVPLSIAQWHLHTNWCLPPRDAGNRTQKRGSDGRPLFGPQGSITTEAACRAAGGRFHPQLFGWMVHVHPLATDPADMWGAEDMTHMSMPGMSGTH